MSANGEWIGVCRLRDEAVRRGTPALAVDAQDSSRPILERCGFEVVCMMYELEPDA